eukprot:TRINITY_DN18526_c0_g1_i1.p1 TRINITY_DN18526_c0_g1~~TRINITY_DN18526_c0_g1_i1.p1  ORF type:complete len:261 (+),score=60.68 TRINITY_DN18526_c0_g1_i1:30-812(+)
MAADKANTPVTVARREPCEVVVWGGARYAVTRPLLFYSHARRTDAEKADDGGIGPAFDRRVFSNLYPVKVTIKEPYLLEMLGGRAEWPSTEHVFQAAKCALDADKEFILTLNTGDAARYGQGRLHLSSKQRDTLVDKLGVNAADLVKASGGKWKRSANGRVPLIDNWDGVKRRVMMSALRAKFLETPLGDHLRTLAASNVNFFLVEHTANDRQWADNGDGTGTNFLGKLLTQLMVEIRERKEIPLDDTFLTTPNNTFLQY